MRREEWTASGPTRRWFVGVSSRRAQRRAAAEVFRPDLYCRSLPAAPLAAAAPPPFDGTEFVASEVPAYLEQFEVHTPFAEARLL
jgi:hypothetical protein